MHFDFSPQWIRGIKGLSTDLPVGVNELSPPDRVEIHVSTILFQKKPALFSFCCTNEPDEPVARQLKQHLRKYEHIQSCSFAETSSKQWMGLHKHCLNKNLKYMRKMKLQNTIWKFTWISVWVKHVVNKSETDSNVYNTDRQLKSSCSSLIGTLIQNHKIIK